MTRQVLIFIFLLSLLHNLTGQHKIWISHEDTGWFEKRNIEAEFCSEWLEECSYVLPDSLFLHFNESGIIHHPVIWFKPAKIATVNEPILSFALEQVEAHALISAGLTGKNIKIGVIDGGFLKANSSPSLAHLFDRDLVKSYQDYITPTMEPYGGSAPLDDVHGTEVMVYLGGKNEKKNIQYGLATDALYYLARTDHGAYEKRLEEDLLIRALENMYKDGVRLVNISLGYAAGYVRPEENYSPSDMDGKTSAIARAVDSAFYSKNMLVVVAAGNEGFDPKWKVLSTPGDAKGALTVGATKLNIWDKMDYSSIGTPSLSYLKPEISCFATEGTSFSTPIITGIAAAIMQYDSTLTAAQVKSVIEQSGNYFPYGNNYLGYGVPRCSVILSLLRGSQGQANKPKKVETSKKKHLIKRQFERNYLVAFHKMDHFRVIEREVYRPDDDRVKITRCEGAVQTSVLIDNEVIEIFWK